ncbi:MAG: hypothetical protein AAF799_34675 [Myxococcota bacterium]
MDVSLGDDTDLLLSGSATVQLGEQAVPLVLQLEDDEVIDGLTLRIVRAADASMAPVGLDDAALDSDGSSLLSALTWIAANFGDTYALSRFQLDFTAKPNPLVVRLGVARGDSSWYPPPGPQRFDMGGALQLNAAFPNTIADRLMLEFFVESTGGELIPAAVSLAATPLAMTYGLHARDISVGLQGRRTFLRSSGEASTDGVTVDGLLEHVGTELDRNLRGQTITIELTAEVRGSAVLEWELSSHRVEEQFQPDLDTVALEIEWDGIATQLLPLPADGSSEVLGLSLGSLTAPKTQRVVLAPQSTMPGPARSQLVRPLYDAAQALSVSDSRPLAGIDIYARLFGQATSVRLGIHPDDEGQPRAAPLFEVTRTFDAEHSTEPAWISFELETPQPLPTSLYWLVLRSDEGDIAWFVDTPSPENVDGLTYRRDGGLWLPRGSNTESPWGQTRLRVVETTEPTAPSFELAGYETLPSSSDDPPTFVAVIEPADDGSIAWFPDDAQVPPVLARLDLRIASSVATTLSLSELELQYRSTTSG